MADKVLHIDSQGELYAKLLPPISGDLDDLEPANEDVEPFAIAVYQVQDGELYVDDDYVDDGYVETGIGGAWRKMSLAQLKSWLEYIPPEDVADPYVEPDYVDPDYVGE